MNKNVDMILHTIARELGSELESAYLYGSLAQQTYQAGDSDVNLLLILSNSAAIHPLRDVFQPLWKQYGDGLRRAPLVATRPTLARHMQLRPTLAHHLANEGQAILGGSRLLKSLPQRPLLTPRDTYARLALDLMEASVALASDMLSPEAAQGAMVRLRSLARQIFGKPVSSQETAVTLFARLHDHLDPKIAALPTDQPWSADRTATSPLLPGLQATYARDMDKMVLLFAHLSEPQIRAISWTKLAERLARDYKSTYVATSAQYRLINEVETPLDLALRRNKHTWGLDPLASLSTTHQHKLRHAARLPSDILVDALPNAYLTGDDDQIHTIIHDFQNKLLNVRLENELLNRLQVVERFSPPTPLPGREAPSLERIDAIFQHLDCWADHYVQEMVKAV